ncbi:uncharacterized protein LOC104902757 isoform X2 [Beta vulgaris subsp. vulgaris]|nr:uncharacterized protein LOC104902757 isoform X2 [Beta vulgaris subsp. vulgaris]
MALKRKKGEGSCSSADSGDSIKPKPKPKPKRKQMSASTFERPNMHWEAEWNMPFLDLLDDICKGRERSIGRAFDNAFWLEFAALFCTKIGRSGITAEDCKERTRFFKKKFRDYEGDAPTAEDRKIISVYRRDPVPKVPRAPAGFGASGEASGSSSRSRSRSRARSRPCSTASCGSTPEEIK